MPVGKGSKHARACFYAKNLTIWCVGFHDQVKIINFNPCGQPDYHFLGIKQSCVISSQAES